MMKSKFLMVLLAGSFLMQRASAQLSLSTNERMQWWREARFGMFIHFGVYAQLAGEYKGHQQAKGGAEWILNRMKIPVSEYRSIAKQFNPVKFDADAYVKTAKDAGMKYLIITAKHHDGFALFDSKASDWDIVDASPYKKDLLKPLAAACKKYGIKLGFYYSQAQDWVNPGGTVARKEMREGWPNPDSARIDNYTIEHKGHWDPVQETRSFEEYIDKVAVPQVKELLTGYGDVSVIWWDTPVGMTDEAALKIQNVVKKYQPNIITNDRLKRPNFPGDTKSPEQKIPNLTELDGKDWETCMTMNDTWGYRKSDNNWKSSETLIRNLVDIASKSGNYLLNVGPKADGSFPQESIDRLKAVGLWMKVNGEAIYGTSGNPLEPVTWGRITSKPSKTGTTLYLFVFEWPSNGRLLVSGLKNRVLSAAFLAGGKSVKTSSDGNGVMIQLHSQALYEVATVIKLEVQGTVDSKVLNPVKQMKTGELD